MNKLIADVFGDDSITLDCDSAECLPRTEVPGYKRPEKPSNTGLIASSLSAAIVLLVALGFGVWYAIRRSQQDRSVGVIRLPNDESSKLSANHFPTTLHFRSITYAVSGHQVLKDIHGVVKPGELMAIVGASGAGKTSFLDILAGKNKRGKVSGEVMINGRIFSAQEYKHVVGFVDQEDALMATLTVYETILYSALLRLPYDMSTESKINRVRETMNELGIAHLRDCLIGKEGRRGISGGEKRRVSIACELVTRPSILFLDEPV